MLFEKSVSGIPYEIRREADDTILRVDCEKLTMVPAIEDNANLMSFVVERLIENKGVTRIVFVQKRDYEYDYGQVRMLSELAATYNRLIKQKDLFSFGSLSARLQAKMARNTTPG